MKTPRFWLVIWGALGALVLVYVMIAASLKPASSPRHSGPQHAGAGHSSSGQANLLTGEMADFTVPFPPRRAPEIPFQRGSDDAAMVTLQDFSGQVVLVNFWATWCAPCLKELPSLNRLQTQFDPETFKIIAIAADPRGPEAAGDYLERLEIDALELFADPRLLFASAIGGANVLPVSILYDKNGQEVGRLVGEAVWDSPEAIGLIRAVLAGKKVS